MAVTLPSAAGCAHGQQCVTSNKVYNPSSRRISGLQISWGRMWGKPGYCFRGSPRNAPETGESNQGSDFGECGEQRDLVWLTGTHVEMCTKQRRTEIATMEDRREVW